MEPWERLFWSCRPGFPSSVLHPRTDYALTDFRIVVRRRGALLHEIALDDIAAVRLEQSWRQRLAATSNVRISSRRAGRGILLRDIHHGPQLALILQLLASDGQSLDQQFVRDALSTDASPLLRPNHAV